jgi:membrane protein implicated in regulation of membrane protease activity
MAVKQTTKFVTFAIIPFLIAAILGYDVYAIMTGGTDASISALIIKSSYEMPFMTFSIGFFMGVLVGHLFWRMRSNDMTKEIDKKE